MMWVNKSERAWRRRAEEASLIQAGRVAEGHFAAYFRAIDALLDDPVGQRWVAQFGVDQRMPPRSTRLPPAGGPEGLAVLEAVVLAGTVGRLLADAAFVRWLSKAQPASLSALHLAAEPMVPETQGDILPPAPTVRSG